MGELHFGVHRKPESNTTLRANISKLNGFNILIKQSEPKSFDVADNF